MKSLLTKLMWLGMILAISGCGPQATPTLSPTNTTAPTIVVATAAPEPTRVIELTPTKPMMPVQTATSSTTKQGLQLIWSIQSGNIIAVGAAADGKLYGYLNDLPPKYVVLSNTGQVLQTTPIKDLLNCYRGIKSWFVVRSNGTIISTGRMGSVSACVFEPGDPPVMTLLQETGGYLPYSKDPKSADQKTAPWPSGFEGVNRAIYSGIYWNDSRDVFFNQFAINRSTRQGLYINQNGEIALFKFPEDFDFEKNLDGAGFFFSVMPWDDVYVQYSIWDALGNLTGKKSFKVSPDGTITPLDRLPSQVGSFSMPIVSYLPDLNKLYVLNLGLSIDAYDTNFNLLATYILPAEIKNMNENQLFVGNDLALYYFNSKQKILSKYALPGN